METIIAYTVIGLFTTLFAAMAVVPFLLNTTPESSRVETTRVASPKVVPATITVLPAQPAAIVREAA